MDDTWENLCASIKFYEKQTCLCELSSKLHGLQRNEAKKGLLELCPCKSAGRARQMEDNAGEQVMSSRDRCLFAAKSGDSSTEPVPEPSRLTMSSEQMEKLRASNPSISHYAWLVDSGATCHVLSDQAYRCMRLLGSIWDLCPPC